MNQFVNAARNQATETVTENGHYAVNTTGSKLLDLYGLCGGMRNADILRLTSMFEEAAQENMLLAMRLLFYIRDIRGGVGERNVFRRLLKYAADKHTDVIVNLLPFIPEYGRWDDLFACIGTKCEDAALYLVKETLLADRELMLKNESVSLCAKWCHSINCRNRENRIIAKKTAITLGMSPAEYRHLLSSLRGYLDIAERHISVRDYSGIRYDAVPAKAMLKYRNLFMKNDTDRFKAYIDSVSRGEAEIKTGTVTPYDLLAPVIRSGHDDPVITEQWNHLPDYIDTGKNILCMVDVSGSMECCNAKPLIVALSLGMYFAEHNHGDFHNLFMTFSEKPKFVTDNSKLSLAQRVCSMSHADWGVNTNLRKAFESVLNLGIKNNIPAADMPACILVISDMEIDNSGKDNQLFYEEVAEMYQNAGYEMPGLIFWNVRSGANRFQVNHKMPNCQLASGESPAVFKQVIAALGMTPYEAMLKTLNSPRYACINIDINSCEG